MSIKAVLGGIDIHQPTASVYSIATGPHEITVTMSITGGYEELAKIASERGGSGGAQEFELVPVSPRIVSPVRVDEEAGCKECNPAESSFEDGGDW